MPGHETGKEMVRPGVHVDTVKTGFRSSLGRVDELLFDDLDLFDGQLLTGGCVTSVFKSPTLANSDMGGWGDEDTGVNPVTSLRCHWPAW